MRIVTAASLGIALLVLVALSVRGGVFAQDATPIPDGSPVVDEPTPDDASTPTSEAAVGFTIVVIEHATSDTVIDLGEEGDSLGDLLVFANDIYDESNTTLIGTDQGSCTRTIPGEAYECAWTLTLDDGQIMVQGPYLEGEDSVLAVTGGTGAYNGVTGEMTATALSADEIQFSYELR